MSTELCESSKSQQCQRVRGLRTSFSASPSRFQANTRVQATSPGAKSIQGTSRNALRLPASNNIVPRLGLGGWMPRPRKLSAEIKRNTKQKRSPNSASRGAVILGKISFLRIQTNFSPLSLEAGRKWLGHIAAAHAAVVLIAPPPSRPRATALAKLHWPSTATS